MVIESFHIRGGGGAQTVSTGDPLHWLFLPGEGRLFTLRSTPQGKSILDKNNICTCHTLLNKCFSSLGSQHSLWQPALTTVNTASTDNGTAWLLCLPWEPVRRTDGQHRVVPSTNPLWGPEASVSTPSSGWGGDLVFTGLVFTPASANGESERLTGVQLPCLPSESVG